MKQIIKSILLILVTVSINSNIEASSMYSQDVEGYYFLSKVHQTREAINPLLEEINYKERKDKICGTCNITELKEIIEQIAERGKQAINEENDELTLGIFTTLYAPVCILNIDADFISNMGKCREDRMFKGSPSDFFEQVTKMSREHYTSLMLYYKEKGKDEETIKKKTGIGRVF